MSAKVGLSVGSIARQDTIMLFSSSGVPSGIKDVAFRASAIKFFDNCSA